MIAYAKIGLVLIGRNEGERLKASLKSCSGMGNAVVYVDSGSTDGSVEYAKSSGADVVELDLSIPFTAARARNAGFERLLQLHPDLKYVHFIDGDCILQQGWLNTAEQFMESHPDVAVVCGIRRELYPEKSLYNWMSDVEWNQPAGETSACGGDALYRTGAFTSVTGFNASLLCAEEPELCLRLRKNKWRIWRLADTMTMHDAAILHFSQYWKRSVRSGYGNSRVALMYWRDAEAGGMKDIIRPLVYSALFLCAIPLTLFAGLWGLAPLAIVALQVGRIASTHGISKLRSWKFGLVQTLTKLAETQGILAMALDVVSGKTRKIIEYK
jgi:GT2 family glycosyltransferase